MSPAPAPVATVERLAEHVGQVVTLRGWIYNRTSKGKLHFTLLRDGTGIVQCVLFQKSVPPELFAAVGAAGQESSLELSGLVKEDARAPGGFEVEVRGGRVLQSVQDFPITPKEHGADFLLSRRHLWLRSRRQWAVLRVRDAVITARLAATSESDTQNSAAPPVEIWTRRPSMASESTLRFAYAPPTMSRITSTPRPAVMRFTSATKSASL